MVSVAMAAFDLYFLDGRYIHALKRSANISSITSPGTELPRVRRIGAAGGSGASRRDGGGP
jgi:hypothetical protein